MIPLIYVCFLTGLTPLPRTPPISSSPTLQSNLTPTTIVNTSAIVNCILVHGKRGGIPRKTIGMERRCLSFDIHLRPSTLFAVRFLNRRAGRMVYKDRSNIRCLRYFQRKNHGRSNYWWQQCSCFRFRDICRRYYVDCSELLKVPGRSARFRTTFRYRERTGRRARYGVRREVWW